ncbi:DUF3592 domain-containing protein [Gordonia paraffinivorans]|uniref:DUF3592 domain-containing protein n=1 Tax=Gordonia paraffinivorans TaxID=175628 RepID=UPI0024304ED9|nr:DUF3592 domain-containing protein [Gordonia paraffinivorans]
MTPVIQRRVQLGLLVVGLTITAMAFSLIVGCFKDDAAIESSKATVMAEVVSVDPLHAAVAFQTPDGSFHSPRFGLLYPTELSEGQRISVEYAAYNPDLARPTGRTAMLSIIPGLSVAFAGWAVVGLLMVVVAEFGRRSREAESAAQDGDDAPAGDGQNVPAAAGGDAPAIDGESAGPAGAESGEESLSSR